MRRGDALREDFRPQWSDIDFVGMLERVPTGDDLAALAIDKSEQ
jgi:hypothetical protein